MIGENLLRGLEISAFVIGRSAVLLNELQTMPFNKFTEMGLVMY